MEKKRKAREAEERKLLCAEDGVDHLPRSGREYGEQGIAQLQHNVSSVWDM